MIIQDKGQTQGLQESGAAKLTLIICSPALDETIINQIADLYLISSSTLLTDSEYGEYNLYSSLSNRLDPKSIFRIKRIVQV